MRAFTTFMLIFWTIVAAGCGDDDVSACRCDEEVPGGRVLVACGGSQCVGGNGYRCSSGLLESDPGACMPVTDGGPVLTDDGGPTPVDAGPAPNCQIAAGRWIGTGVVDPASTDPSCEAALIDGNLESLEAFVAIPECPAECSCNMTPASLPDCVASGAIACSDGSAFSSAAQKASATDVSYSISRTNVIGQTCTVNGSIRRSDGCDNTCEFRDDGECDDGGSGAVTSLCDFGSDCADCGPR